MSPFIKSASLACASLGALVFTHCGGSSSDVEGKAPSEAFMFNNGAKITCTLLDTTVVNTLVENNILPPIFTITTISDLGVISDENQQLPTWNDRTGTVTYTKTGENSATLSIQEIIASGEDELAETTLLSITSKIKFTSDTQGTGKTTIQNSPANHQGTQTFETDAYYTFDYSHNNN